MGRNTKTFLWFCSIALFALPSHATAIAQTRSPDKNEELKRIDERISMKMIKKHFESTAVFMVCCMLVVNSGCATKKQTGALAGAGVGALLGQAIGGNTAGTLIGAGVGTGVGYLIGNEMDKKDAKSRETVTAQETAPLANTTWQLVSIVPQARKDVKSLVIHLKPDGTALTTRSFTDDSVKTATERYRVVGETLIINQDDYVINARFSIKGDQLIANTDKYSIVLRRVDI